MINKKGLSHIEIILSFVIFVGFLIFVLAIFKPFKGVDSDRGDLDILERQINSYAGVSVNFFTLNLSKSIAESCFKFPSKLVKITAEDESGNSLKAGSDGNLISVQKARTFYYIYSSSEFIEPSLSENGLSSCTPLEINDYNLGVFRSINMMSNTKLREITARYASDYSNFRNELGIVSDFSFEVKDTQGNVIFGAEKDIPRGYIVSARDVPVQIINNTGKIQLGIINIKIW